MSVLSDRDAQSKLSDSNKGPWVDVFRCDRTLGQCWQGKAMLGFLSSTHPTAMHYSKWHNTKP